MFNRSWLWLIGGFLMVVLGFAVGGLTWQGEEKDDSLEKAERLESTEQIPVVDTFLPDNEKAEVLTEDLSDTVKGIDLRNWKLTLPDRTASEIEPDELRTYKSAYFERDESGFSFWCTVVGGTTKNSKYPRSELRELLDPNDNSVNWTSDGTHSLMATVQVLEVPSTQKVIIGQVHAFEGRPLVKLQWRKGKVEVLFKELTKGDNGDVKHVFEEGKDLGEAFDYQIEVTDGVARVTVGDELAEYDFVNGDHRWEDELFYFKAGAYCQDNEGDENEGARVRFMRLERLHN